MPCPWHRVSRPRLGLAQLSANWNEPVHARERSTCCRCLPYHHLGAERTRNSARLPCRDRKFGQFGIERIEVLWSPASDPVRRFRRQPGREAGEIRCSGNESVLPALATHTDVRGEVKPTRQAQTPRTPPSSHPQSPRPFGPSLGRRQAHARGAAGAQLPRPPRRSGDPIARNRVQRKHAEAPPFDLVTKPTKLQRQALDLLGVSL